MKRLQEFWSVYSKQIVRFWTNQLVMSFLGISVGLATIAFGNFAISALGCVFTIGFLCFLQYDNLFQLGEKDHYRPADVPRPAKTLGWKVTLLGSCPLFLVILVGLLLSLLSSDDAQVICMLVYYALHGSYLQLQTYFVIEETIGWLGGPAGWLLCLLFTVPAILSGALGYFLGAIDRPLRTFIGLRYTGDGKK